MNWLRGSARDSLAIEAESVVFYQVPTPDTIISDGPSPPATVAGRVVLRLTKARQFTDLEIGLEGVCDVGGAHFKTLDVKATISVGACEPGEHSIAFRLEFPKTTAQTVSCPEGSVVHRLWARGAELKASRSIVLVGHGHPENEAPPTFELSLDGHHDEVHSYQFTAQAERCTVGSLIGTRLLLNNCPPESADCKTTRRYRIISTEISVRQIAHCSTLNGQTSSSERDMSLVRTEVTPDKMPVLERTYGRMSTGVEGADDPPVTKMHELDERGYVSYLVRLDVPGADPEVQYIRVPGHTMLGPTTPRGMDTPIRLEHRYKITVGYSLDGKPRVASFLKPMSFASCFCTSANVFLPAYEHTTIKEPPCACVQTIDAIVKDRAGWPDPSLRVEEVEEPDTRPKATYEPALDEVSIDVSPGPSVAPPRR